MKSQYKRDISQQYFWPLKSFHYDPSIHWPTASNKQDELADKLAKEYGIHTGNIFRLILYAGRAWNYATESEIQVYYSDLTEIVEFEKEPEPIKEIFFRGNNKSILISNPYLIDKLYNSLLDFMNLKKILKEKKTDTKKKRPSANIVKLIATEIYNELTQVEKISNWKSKCIAGFIFGFYNIGIKKDDFVMNQEQYEQEQVKRKMKGQTTESYRMYLHGHMKRYINN